VIGLPPLDAGALQDRATVSLPGVPAVMFIAARGTVCAGCVDQGAAMVTSSKSVVAVVS
jgi:hypothetical protein